MADVEEIVPIADESPESTPGYTAPAVVTVGALTEMDQDDESLVRYKQALLGNVSASPADDPRRVIVEQMSFVVAGRDDINLNLSGNLNDFTIVVKEGQEYKIKVAFRIHHEIVAGLRYHHVVKRKGVNVAKQTYMVGSYGPKTEWQYWTSPSDESPKGMIMRGTYKVHSKFIDDDNVTHLEWDWCMEIKKDWK